MKGSVKVRSEFHALLADAPELLHAEHLVPPGIRQDGPVPAHEAVQPPRLLNDLHPWPQIKMIRIAQNQLYAQRFKILREERFHGALRAHRRKDRRVHRPMRGLYAAHTRFCPRAAGDDFEMFSLRFH